MSEHRVLAEQEHHPQRESRIVLRRSKEFGITHDGFAIDIADVRERKRRMVHALNVDGAPFKGERESSELDLILRHAHDDEFRDCKPGHKRSHRATTGGRYENCSGPAHALQYCCRIVDSGTNVGVRAQILRKLFLVAAIPYFDSLESHVPRKLDTKMPKATNALHRDQISTAQAGVAKSVVGRDTCAQERGGFCGAELIRNASYCAPPSGPPACPSPPPCARPEPGRRPPARASFRMST